VEVQHLNKQATTMQIKKQVVAMQGEKQTKTTTQGKK
jgi:hypothetical protein